MTLKQLIFRAFLLSFTCVFQYTSAEDNTQGFGKIGLLSHYIFRGIDFNDNAPVIQSDYLVVSNQGWWLGGFVSNWTVADDSEIEVDLLAGYDYSVSESVTLNGGVVRYMFPGVGGHSTEWSLGLTFHNIAIKRHYDEDLKTHYIEVNYQQAIASNINLKYHIGAYSSKLLDQEMDYQLKANFLHNQSLESFVAYAHSDLTDGQVFAGLYFKF